MSSLHEEFICLVSAVVEADITNDDSIKAALDATNAWIARHTDEIARALKTQEAFDRGEPSDDHAGYFSHEMNYAAQPFKRGFWEGWNAARRFVIQDPP
jgi:hypothetical protein